jgi:hypothetical protein
LNTRWITSVFLVAAGLGLDPISVLAQVRPAAGFDAALRSQYVWRGITRSSGWVLQPDLILGTGWSNSYANVGVWANIELFSTEPGAELSLGRTVGEWNGWIEYSWWNETVDLAFGYTRYWFDDAASQERWSPAFDTGELYADAGWRIGPLEPRLAIWLDLEEVQGAYLELSATYRIPVLPLAIPSLYLGALGGINSGQALDSEDPDEPAYFEKNGLTHVGLWTYTQVYLPVGPLKDLYGTVAFHFQFNSDSATRRAELGTEGADQNTKWWLSLVLSWYD